MSRGECGWNGNVVQITWLPTWKAEDLLNVSVVLFTFDHIASLLKIHPRLENPFELLIAEPFWSGPSPSLRLHLSSRPPHHHHLVHHVFRTLLPFGMAHFLSLECLAISHLSSTVWFKCHLSYWLPWCLRNRSSHPRQSQGPSALSLLLCCIIRTSRTALGLFAFISLPQTWELFWDGEDVSSSLSPASFTGLGGMLVFTSV